MTRGIDPNSIPRYTEPTWDELKDEQPETGACWNCGNIVNVEIEGKLYPLCVAEIVRLGVTGFSFVADPEIDECADWTAS